MSELSLGLSGVMAARKAIETTGYNIASARTPGYARRDIRLSGRSSSAAASRGASATVNVSAVLRVKNMYLQGRLQEYRGALARDDIQNTYFSEIEGILQEPGENGIGMILERFFNQWEALAMRPEDASERTMLLLTAGHLCEQVSSLRAALTDLRTAVNTEISYHVNEVNSLASRLAELNQGLAVESTGSSDAPLDLEDARDRLLADLAEVIGGTNLTPNLTTARVTIGTSLLVDAAQAISLVPPADYNSSITMNVGGSVSVLPRSGKLAGLMRLNQEVIPEYLARLDEFAVTLIKAVNTLHLQGISQDGRFTEITSSNAPVDVDGDGDATNDVLVSAGLPFTPTAGTLTVHVVNNATEAVATEILSVDPTTQSLADLMSAINALDNMTATIQNGKLRIAAAAGYSFDFAADQSSNLLAALGVNAFFTGSDAGSLQLASRLADHPERIAAGSTTDSGDGAIAIAMSELRYAKVADGDKITLSDYWRWFVTEIGNESANLVRSSRTLTNMVDLLDRQEQNISGVSLDEEAARLLEYQQMYAACAQFLGVVAKLSETLLQYI